MKPLKKEMNIQKRRDRKNKEAEKDRIKMIVNTRKTEERKEVRITTANESKNREQSF